MFFSSSTDIPMSPTSGHTSQIMNSIQTQYATLIQTLVTNHNGNLATPPAIMKDYVAQLEKFDKFPLLDPAKDWVFQDMISTYALQHIDKYIDNYMNLELFSLDVFYILAAVFKKLEYNGKLLINYNDEEYFIQSPLSITLWNKTVGMPAYRKDALPAIVHLTVKAFKDAFIRNLNQAENYCSTEPARYQALLQPITTCRSLTGFCLKYKCQTDTDKDLDYRIEKWKERRLLPDTKQQQLNIS